MNNMTINELSSIFLEKFKNQSNSSKIVLFLGAGADISSGGMSFFTFKKKFCKKYSQKIIFKNTSVETINDLFDDLLENTIQPENRSHIVEQLFRELKELEPSDAYKILVLLAQKRVIDAIVTTNFDNMLEQAAECLGLPIFQIFSPGISKPYDVNYAKFTLVPYIKLHGDLSARSQLILTQDEIEQGDYDKDILILFEQILKTHTLVIAGYSGSDHKLVEIIEKNTRNANHIYYCNPHAIDMNSPLYSQLRNKLRFVQVSFDTLIENISKPILNKPSLLRFSTTIIEKLLKWRLEYFQTQFYEDHLARTFLAIDNRPIPRIETETQIIHFLTSELPLLIVTGRSGVGKSIIGINTCNWCKQSAHNLFFFIKAKTLDRPELDIYIAESLGGIGSEAASVIFSIENWLERTNHHLIIFLDGLNEYRSSVDECINLFRNILRLLLQLKPNSPIKIIITIREEMWHKVYQHVDHFFLNQILNRGNEHRAYSLINIDRFSNEEFIEAINRLSDSSLNIFDKSAILTGYDQLRDPFFLNAIYKHTNAIDGQHSFLKIFEYSIEEKLSTCNDIIHLHLLLNILPNVAFRCLESDKSFNLRQFCYQQNIHMLEDKLVDLGFIIRTNNGEFRFSHDRYHEYFLSKAFGFAGVPDILNSKALQKFILDYKDDALVIAAAKMYFLLNEDSINTLQVILLECFTKKAYSSFTNKEKVFLFIKDVLIELSIDNPVLSYCLLEDLLCTSRISILDEELIRGLILIIVHLPKKEGFQLFRRIIEHRDDLSSIEAEIFLADYIIEYYCTSSQKVDLLNDEPFVSYFNAPNIPVWKKMTRFFGLIEKLGPFNLNKAEYQKIIAEISSSLFVFLSTNSFSEDDCRDYTDYVLKFCNRLFFNATSKEIQAFFEGNEEKKEFFYNVFEHLEQGGTLNVELYGDFRNYITRIGNNCEFHLCKLAFILSSKNDYYKTIVLWKQIFESFNEDTPAEEVDFLQATLLYLFAVNEVLYTKDFDIYFEKVLNDWPRILEYTPGLIRSQWRNMNDDFDKIFEDGFNPIASYIYLQPVVKRQSLNYIQYKDESNHSNSSIADSLFFIYLKKYIEKGDTSKALRIIHALCSHIMLWPEDGFAYLPVIASSNDPLIRRSYIRMLTECYHRYPIQTLNYLRTHGFDLSDDEISKIKIRLDPKIGYRQIEDLEWANIIHFFLSVQSKHKTIFYRTLKGIIKSNTLYGAVQKAFYFIGLTKEEYICSKTS